MTTPTIIRTPKDGSSPYVATSRAAAQDERLSFEARGLLWYLLSKPSDWKVVIGDLMKAGHCGRNRVYRILRELQDEGYLVRERGRDEKGRLMTPIYRVYEQPHTQNRDVDGKAETEGAPRTQNPHVDNGTLQNRDDTEQKDLAETPKAVVSAGDGQTSQGKRTGTNGTAKPKTERQLMFEAICAAFGYDAKHLTDSKRGAINRVIAELVRAGAHPTDVPGLHAYCKGQFTRFGPNAYATNWNDYRAQHRPAAASAIVRDPDCAVCGGTGLVLPALGAYEDGDPRANTPIQCPVCVKAARASEAQREAVGP